MNDMKVTMAFLSGPDGPHSYDLNDVQKQSMQDEIDFFVKKLLDHHREFAPNLEEFASMKAKFDETFAPGFEPFSLYCFTHHIEKLGSDEGDLTFIWPGGYCEYLRGKEDNDE